MAFILCMSIAQRWGWVMHVGTCNMRRYNGKQMKGKNLYKDHHIFYYTYIRECANYVQDKLHVPCSPDITFLNLFDLRF